MGQNLKTRQKRRRRKLYLKRKSDRLKAGAANKPASPAKTEKPVKKAAKKAAKKATKKVAKKAAKKAASPKAEDSQVDKAEADVPKDTAEDKE